MAKMIGSGILHLSLLTVTGWQWHARKIVTVYVSLPTTFNPYAWGRLFIILHSWNPLPEWELLGFLGDRYSYDEESKRKEERQEARMVWFSSYKNGRIIPGFVQSNRCLVCHHGGEAYKPMSHLKGKLQKEVPAKVLLFHSNQCIDILFLSSQAPAIMYSWLYLWYNVACVVIQWCQSNYFPPIANWYRSFLRT